MDEAAVGHGAHLAAQPERAPAGHRVGLAADIQRHRGADAGSVQRLRRFRIDTAASSSAASIAASNPMASPPASSRFCWPVRRGGQGRHCHGCFDDKLNPIGASQDLAGAGFGLPEILIAGGWRSPEMVSRYTEHLAARRGAMAKLAERQNRA